VSQSTAAHEEHRDDKQHERDKAKVAATRQALLASPKMRGEAALAQEAPEELQASVRRQPLLPKFDAQVTLDSGPKTAFSYPHWKWPFSSEIFESQQPEKITTCRPLPAFSAAHPREECPFRANSAGAGPNTQEAYSLGDSTSPDSPVGKWVCLEWEFNDTPDEVRVFVEGTLAWSYAPISYQNVSSGLVGGFSDVAFGYYIWHPGSTDFDVYYDDIVLDTKRVGCLPSQ